ncbi:glycoside hydrolase [Cryomyces antarcticus]
MRWQGDVLVSTYSGEPYGDSFYSGVKSALSAEGTIISFTPAFTSHRDPSEASSLLSAFPSIDGFFNWWSWPADTDTNLTTATDLAYQQAIKSSRKGPYIMSVSPWQSKELGGYSDWVELSDTLWKYRWEQAINEVVPDIVEIVTWNDYPESHYIADLNPKVNLGDLAPAYVNGFEHGRWRIIAQYYIAWFKTGHAPVVKEDRVVYWYRAHPKAVTCSGGDRPRNSAHPVDDVFAFALMKETATIPMDIGSSHAEFRAGPGVTMGSVPFPVEDSQVPYIQIIKNGRIWIDACYPELLIL